MDRAELVRAVSDRLGEDQLVWFGTRGDDVEALSDIPQLRAAFSLIANYGGRSRVQGLSLEDLTGARPDLDTYEIDEDPVSTEGRAALIEFRRTLLRVLARPSAVLTYRPSAFLSAICFARRDRCRYLGLFKDHQSAFEHKPWVETSIARVGLPAIEWTYVADEEQLDTLRFLEEGPVMLRRSRTTGGVGLTLVEDPSRLKELWPKEPEGYVSVARFLPDAIPVNVGAVVWHDGVTVHPASVQLIGVDGCTARPFGFCGNDFAAAAGLGDSTLDQIERSVIAIGRWLQRFGFLGAFGVDFLVVDGVPRFTEINPRLQGSTHASCRLSVEQDESCLLIEHVASNLGMDAPRSRPLRSVARDSEPLSHLVVHWLGAPAHVDGADLVDRARRADPGLRADVIIRPDLLVATGATVARLTVGESITTDGFSIYGNLRASVDEWLEDIRPEGGGPLDRGVIRLT